MSQYETIIKSLYRNSSIEGFYYDYISSYFNFGGVNL